MPENPSSKPVAPGALPDRSALECQLAELIGQHLFEMPSGAGPDTNLYQAGLDSMAMMQLLILIENHFGLILSDADLSRENFSNIRCLAGLIRERLTQRGLPQ